MTKKKPSKAEAKAIIYGKLIEAFSDVCFVNGIIATLNYVPADIDQGTLRLAIQRSTAEIFVRARTDQTDLLLSDYLNFCNELNNRYEQFGFYELTLS